MRKKVTSPRAKDLAWDLFEKTGEISYYLLYKKLEEK